MLLLIFVLELNQHIRMISGRLCDYAIYHMIYTTTLFVQYTAGISQEPAFRFEYACSFFNLNVIIIRPEQLTL